MKDYIIEITDLSKYYGRHCALEDINLQIESQEIVGLLGPNGAGKTTLMKLICSLLFPTKGSIFINGIDILKDVAYKQKLAYMAENAGYYENMTAYNYLMLFAYYHSLDSKRKKCQDSLEAVNLLDDANRKISTYSKGMKQRLGIARCLLNDPELLLMDEPLTALDPHGKRDIINILTKLRDEGKTVVLSSHELRYMDNMCDKLCIIQAGRLVESGAPNKIISHMVNYLEYEIELKTPCVDLDRLRVELPEIIELGMTQNILRMHVKKSEDFEKRFLMYLLQNGIDFTVQTNKLDKIYSNFFDEGCG